MLPKGEVEGLVIFGGMWSFVISVSFIVLFCFRFARTVGKRKETHNLMSAFFLLGVDMIVYVVGTTLGGR